MKRFIRWPGRRSAAILAAILLLAVTAVLFALTLGNADGVWSNAASYGGAATPIDCLGYSDQGASTSDENQVRYGYPDDNCWPFNGRSGFGFNGTNGPLLFAPGEIFLLGQFTHYNNIITVNDLNNRLRTVDLAVTLAFDDPAALNPTLNYTMLLDETVNNAVPCPYGDSTGNGCDDKVTFPAGLPDQTFEIGGVTYTLQIVGFVPGTTATCSAAGGIVDNFVTGEEQRNDACLFGRVLEVAYDYGDAPDHNGQTIAPGTAARHAINPAGPSLGSTRPDAEPAGFLCADCGGDDRDNIADEDGFGFTFPDQDWTDGTGTLQVLVGNLAPLSMACVTGWIDVGQDGFANDTPAAATAVANGPLDLTFNVPIVPPPNTPLRLRLTPGECPATPVSPAGLLQGGEVEDYLISVPLAVRLHDFQARPAGLLDLLRALFD